jgi:hypothetical protein
MWGFDMGVLVPIVMLIIGLKAATPKIKLGSSIVLIIVGLFNIYTSFDLRFFLRTLFP